MGRLPPHLEEKRRQLLAAAHRGAFDSYMRHGRVSEAYERIAAVANGAKALDTDVALSALSPTRPIGRPTTHYVWRTAGDSRVRSAHALRNGQIFAWDHPPEHGHPGQEPNCRCWPEPYYGNPAVPDALLTLIPERRVNTDPGTLWASIDTLTRPDGSLAASDVVMRDGTVVSSTFVGRRIQSLVRLPDSTALHVEKEGDRRKTSVSMAAEQPLRVAWLGRALFPGILPPPPSVPSSEASSIAAFPEEDPTLARAITPAAIIVRGALALYNLLQREPEALGAGPADVPVVVHRVWQSQAGAAPVLVTETLTQEQVAQMCPHVAEVQSFIDLAAQEWAPLAGVLKPNVIGTNIHMSAKRRFEAAKAVNPGLYATMNAEVSLDLAPVNNRDAVGVTYGTAGSTRLDVLELVSPHMGCIYDYKTGSAGLTPTRVLKVARVWYHRYPGVPVVIIEMRQGNPVWSQ